MTTFAGQKFSTYITDSAWGIVPGSNDVPVYGLIITQGFDSLFRATGGTGDSVVYFFRAGSPHFPLQSDTSGGNTYYDIKDVAFGVVLPARADFVMITGVPAYCHVNDATSPQDCIENSIFAHDEPRICIRNPAAPSDVCSRRVDMGDLYSGNGLGGHELPNSTLGQVGNIFAGWRFW